VKVTLSALDNAAFARAAPDGELVGTVGAKVVLEDWGSDWNMLELDTPLEYLGRAHPWVLIRSRWQGHTVGGYRDTAVFILLPKGTPTVPGVRSADFDFVSWGLAHTLGAA